METEVLRNLKYEQKPNNLQSWDADITKQPVLDLRSVFPGGWTSKVRDRHQLSFLYKHPNYALENRNSMLPKTLIVSKHV